MSWNAGLGWSAQQDTVPESATDILLQGSQHAVVGPIVCGHFMMAQLNHNRPSYKKEPAPGKPDVMLYFWDERDGPNNSGWWISPKVGSDVVWGFHPNKNAKTPPTSGWKVPYDGPVDPNFKITVTSGGKGGGAQQWNQGGKGAQQWNQGGGKGAQPQQWNQGGQQPRQWTSSGGGGGGGQQQWNQNQQWGWGGNQQSEAERQKQEAARKAREEEQKRKAEETRKNQVQAQAMLAIRKFSKQLEKVAPEGLDALLVQVDEIVAKELDKCGTQKEPMQREVDTAREAAKARCVKTVEDKKKAEELRIENEKKAKEAAEFAAKHLAELEPLVIEAESAVEAVKEAAAVFAKEDGLTTEKEVAKAAAAVAAAVEHCKERSKACTDFINEKGAELKAPQIKKKEEKKEEKKDEEKTDGDKEEKKEEEEKPTFATLQRRVGNTCTVCTTQNNIAKKAEEKATKAINAKTVFGKREAAFKKYAKSGTMDKKDVVKFAKGENKVTLSEASAERIVKSIVTKGEKGVKAADVQRLRVAVGIEKEKLRDEQRKKTRLAKEEKLAALKAELDKEIAKAKEGLDAAGEAVKAAEKDAALKLVVEAKASAYVEHADKVEVLAKTAKESVAKAQVAIKEFDGDKVEVELKAGLLKDVKTLTTTASNMENRVSKVENIVKKLRNDAKKMAAQEMEKLRNAAVTLLRHHMSKKELTNKTLFEAIAGADDKMQKDEFVTFMKKKCEKPEGDAAPTIPDDELPRLFDHLDEENEGFLSQDSFGRTLRTYMRVIKETVLTSGFNVGDKDTKILNRFSVGDVVEILGAPQKDDGVGVTRVQAKIVCGAAGSEAKDESAGWITSIGNNNTHFLKECTATFKVVKETILTDNFDLSAPGKDSIRSMTATNNKLVVGDIVEVREWPKKEETSGLTRMKCRVKADGRIGWATSLGNAGAVFLQII